MTLTENTPKQKGLNSLHELSELVTRQGFCIGQEVFYKSNYYTEKVVITGYVFKLEANKTRLGYCVETVASIRQVLEGTSDFPDEMLVGIDDLVFAPNTSNNEKCTPAEGATPELPSASYVQVCAGI